MAPRRTTRSTADSETINATMITNAQLQAMIDQGVTAALATRDALRSTNGDDSHNSETGTVGHEAAYDMSWKTLMKMMTDKYCPRNEIKKLEMELWELNVKVQPAEALAAVSQFPLTALCDLLPTVLTFWYGKVVHCAVVL
nr:hypothetical protein [Tanacetum cinerariifolium]